MKGAGSLNRALAEGPETRICNCTVVVLFAGFYVEANLNQIVYRLGRKASLTKFAGGKKHPGLQDKLGWFYNEFVTKAPAPDLKVARGRGIYREIRRRSPGFAQLYRFRNDISHGVINDGARSLAHTQRVRQQAKTVVAELFDILDARGHRLRRGVTYHRAIR